MTSNILIALGFVALIVVCGLVFWIGHLAGKAALRRSAQAQRRTILATMQSQASLDQVQASAAPDDTALDQRLTNGTF